VTTTECDLKRATIYGQSLMASILSIIDTTETRGAPDAATLIYACRAALIQAQRDAALQDGTLQ
jgi:hypothetical protein